jgi:FAD/FMN-containing dehydrogenase
MPRTAVPDTISEHFGPERIRVDTDLIAQVSGDLSCEAWTPALGVFAPRSVEELQWLLPAAAAQGVGVVARGAGMSYTRSHVPTVDGTLVLDLADLADVLEVNARDRYAVVQPGCTWEKLYVATSAVGLRVPCWGPLSGRRSTLGGAVAQDGGFFGMAGAGSIRDHVLGLEVVLSDGRRVRTGSLAAPGGSGARTGPDLTGIFTGDSGAFGVKTAIALRLETIPPAVGSASWACATRSEVLDLMEAVGALDLAAEVFAFDPLYHELLAGLGFRDVAGQPWTLHATVEGRDQSEVAVGLQALAALPTSARRIDSSVPLSLRADPFGATQLIFSEADPGVHLPIHAVVPRSRAARAADLLDGYLVENAAELDQHHIRTWGLMSCVGDHVLLECSLYFRGGYRDTEDPSGTRAAAVRIRREMVDTMGEAGVAHYQVGKYYALEETLDADTWSLLVDLKRAADPTATLNPEALGL